jgi:hypothetical protein
LIKVKYSARYLRPLIFGNWNKGLTTLELLIILLGMTIVGAIILPMISRNQEAATKRTTLQVVWMFVLAGVEIFIQHDWDTTWSVSWWQGLVFESQ